MFNVHAAAKGMACSLCHQALAAAFQLVQGGTAAELRAGGMQCGCTALSVFSALNPFWQPCLANTAAVKGFGTSVCLSPSHFSFQLLDVVSLWQ